MLQCLLYLYMLCHQDFVICRLFCKPMLYPLTTGMSALFLWANVLCRSWKLLVPLKFAEGLWLLVDCTRTFLCHYSRWGGEAIMTFPLSPLVHRYFQCITLNSLLWGNEHCSRLTYVVRRYLDLSSKWLAIYLNSLASFLYGMFFVFRAVFKIWKMVCLYTVISKGLYRQFLFKYILIYLGSPFVMTFRLENLKTVCRIFWHSK